MQFTSWTFAVFLALVLALHRPLRRRGQNLLLLGASYVFYGWWDWRFLGLILVSTGVDYSVGRLLPAAGGRRRTGLLIASVATNLGILGCFKYFGFFVASAERLLGGLGLNADVPTLTVILPVGISFYTFQTMAYTIDVFRGKVEPTRDLVLFAVYVAYFPQLVAGPIERAQRLLPQLARTRRASREQMSSGALLVLIGLVRKVAIADVAARHVDAIFSAPDAVGSLTLLMGVALFALQIYGDFAGYTDIARGVSRMLGVELMENFAHPYFACNIADFWRRWHISLSTWLRDYLYIPLGGNRGTRRRTYLNLLVVMVLGGLWHGAGWTFVVWGGIHGLALVAHRAYASGGPRPARSGTAATLGRAASWAGTMAVVGFAWVFFRAPDLATAGSVLAGIVAGFGGVEPGLLTLVVMVATLTLLVDVPQARRGHTAVLRWPWPAQGFAYAAMVLVLVLVPTGAATPFIYFQF